MSDVWHGDGHSSPQRSTHNWSRARYTERHRPNAVESSSSSDNRERLILL
ncbi:MAG TPA: hypothetical protein VGL94_12865 [Ktedonobacteraceae bacterium]|jgi:hypothetical protein